MRITFFFSIFILIGFSNCDSPTEKAPPAITISEFVYEEAPFPSCHASTIEETSNGTIVAAWFGGKHEKNPDVGIWFSRKESTGWTTPREIVNGVQSDTLRYPCWNPVLFQPRTGSLQLYYKVGPNPREWWGMLVTSDDDGNNWNEPQRLPNGFLGPIKNKAIELETGLILSPSSTEHDGWVSHIERSNDNGKSWTKIGPINDAEEFDAIQPTLLTYENGRIQMLCRSKQGYLTQSWSEDQGQSWSPMTKTSLLNPNSGVDAVSLRDGRHLLVYNPTKAPEGEWGGPRSPLNLALSTDGKNWKDALVLEDEEGAEFSYPAVIQSKDGNIHITYTWKRELVKHLILDPTLLN